MDPRLAKFLPVFVGVLLPLILILTNAVWNYGTILLTITSLVWIGFALVLLTPSPES